jgi:hypothetical protein
MNTTNITNAAVSNLTCIVLDPNAPQAKQGFDVWLYTAYCCLVCSYVNINILVFRFWLILSAIFFILWGCDPVRSLQIDTLIFNLFYIVVNIIQSIPLAKQVWPVTLSPLEEEIYERDFKSSMDKRQFKRLISRMETQSYDAHNSQLCVIKSKFNYLIYVAKLNPGWRVVLRKEDTNVITELSEGCWIGTIEYMFELQKKEGDAPIKWGITATIEEIKECVQTNPNYLPTVPEGRLIPNLDDAGCLIYIFDCQVKNINLFELGKL